MDKKEIKKRKKGRVKLVKICVLAIAFVVAIAATYGVTMSYFGQQSDPLSQDFVLKTGIYVNAGGDSVSSDPIYVVPSQILTRKCEVTVSTHKPDGTLTGVDVDSRSKALLRAKIELVDMDGNSIPVDGGTEGADYFFVKIDDSTDARLVKYETDGYYYLVSGSTATEATTTTQLAELNTAADGDVKVSFDVMLRIPKTLTNDDGGETLTLKVTYEAVQSVFYDEDGDLLTPTVGNTSAVFTSLTPVEEPETP